MTTGKNISLTRWTFVGRVMSLLFNMLSRLAIALLPGRKCLLISWLQSPSAVILEPKKIRLYHIGRQTSSAHCLHCFSMYLPWSDGTGCHDLKFLWMLSFKPAFSVVFHFHWSLFSPSTISVIREVSSAYLRLLTFLPAILSPACASSSPAFRMMCSAYKLNKQGDNIQPWCTPFIIWNQSIVPCSIITVASSVAHTFHRGQIRSSVFLIS